jgi:hypothetical protein
MRTDGTFPCPWCGAAGCRPCRWHDDGVEYRCPECGWRHTRKEGCSEALVFFPGDIYGALCLDIEPLFPGPVFGR